MQNEAKDFYAIAVDETVFYDLGDERDSDYIKCIYTVYVFDRTEHTHLCELTPSYFLVPAYTEIVFRDEVGDEMRNHLHEKYASCSEEDAHYAPVSAIENFIENDHDRVDHYGHAEDLEEAREYYQGNRVL